MDCFFKNDKKGKRRKYINFICDDCKIKKEIRLDQYKKKKSNLCNKCHPLHNKQLFKQTIKGLSTHPLYTTWDCMKNRCYRVNNDNYKYYGGKGIIICEEWKNSFLNFYEWAIKNDFKNGLTIDRIDSNKNYEPCNCRFITREENTRRAFKKSLKNSN